jgi:hypothetical protein
MSVNYTPLWSDALYDAYEGVDFSDGGSDPILAHDSNYVTAKFFLKPIQDEVLNLIKKSILLESYLIFDSAGITVADLNVTGGLSFGDYVVLGAEVVSGFMLVTDKDGNSRKIAVVA